MLLSDGSEYRIGYRHLADKSSRKLPCRKTSSTTFLAGQFLCCAVGIYQYICMDARRKQVYTGMYCFLNHQMQVVKEQDAVALEELIKELNQMERPVIFLGDAVPVYKELIQESCKVPYSFAPAHLSRQRAGAVGMLGILYFKEGKTESAAEHKPEYLRVSQAERERAERLKQEKHE